MVTLVNPYINIADHTDLLAIFCPWISTCVVSIREELYAQIPWNANKRKVVTLLHFSEKIFGNSSKPLRFDGTCTLDHYATLFTGPRLRWESVGMFFTAVGLATMNWSHSLSRSSLPAANLNGTVLARQMLDLGQTCITLCEEMGHLTEYVPRLIPRQLLGPAVILVLVYSSPPRPLSFCDLSQDRSDN